MSGDEEVKAKALPEVQNLTDSLVGDPQTSSNASVLSANSSRRLSRFSSNQEPVGFMGKARTEQVN